MKLEITRLEGRRNDLLLRLERAEIDSALLSVANRDALRALPGMVRHRETTAGELHGISEAKIPIEAHLRALGVIDAEGRARLRAVAISNRNLGTNQGHLAWQRDATPRAFRIREDQSAGPRACLVVRPEGSLSIEQLRFDVESDRLFRVGDGEEVGDGIEWATTGQQVLRDGRIASFDELAGEFYDARHLLAFDHDREPGVRIRKRIYHGYPDTFAAEIRGAWGRGVPRARYVHNAVGLSSDALFILQREGTVEEVGAALRDAGADDGLILDNGGSIVCWVWWANLYAGGIISPTVDYRPPGTSAIAFVIKGPLNVDLPGGSVSYSAY
ncbi:MAG TPA: hypothetical protein VM032_12545 [Vicinamibacterales bacterium]|nr:hypothetical protein [Vicinamibacterales bacterium]